MKLVAIILIGKTLLFPMEDDLDCFDAGMYIIKNIGTYHDQKDNDPKRQGYYTQDGNLIVGHYCTHG